jgi:hypothetical protein
MLERIFGILKIFSILIVIFVCLIYNTHAIETTNLFDGFENGINKNIWKIVGPWTISNRGDNFEGKQSLKSELNGKQRSNLSNNIEFWGPCNITFMWKISNGYNKLSLYDNNTSTGYILPSEEYSHCPHNQVNWTKVTYNVSDHSQHKLIWMHENPFDYGAAWIDMIDVTYPIIPRFHNPDVEPKKTFLVRETSNNIDNIDLVAPRFNYSVDSSSKNVVLYIKGPHSAEDAAPRMYHPTDVTINASNELNRFEWKNIKLECNEIGQATYWFVADNRYKSIEISNPEILLFVDDSGSIRKNETRECAIEDYFISIKGSIDARVTLWFLYRNGEWRPYNDTKVYKASNMLKSIYWNNTISCIGNHPEEWIFRIVW